MSVYQVPAKLGCDEKILQNWLTIIEANYNEENSYHNSTHAADVMQAIGKFMKSDRLQMILNPLDDVAALIAAAAHDIDHPGRSRYNFSNKFPSKAIIQCYFSVKVFCNFFSYPCNLLLLSFPFCYIVILFSYFKKVEKQTTIVNKTTTSCTLMKLDYRFSF